MRSLEDRERLSDDVLKGRFTTQVLKEESENMDQAQESLMARRGFRSQEFYNDRSYQVNSNTLEYTHLGRHRFVDMRTRDSKDGKKRKKSHPIHNRILFGHANNIIKQLHFGFTNAVKEKLAKDFS
ncbi:hypothetical protein J0871_17025 [Salegentibacter sp. BDJ18]|uniref:hypothetical protein n=1 Tax=Salegentibacter sp. BDJ18 TaxID=2816376 RepID=UPI001AAF3577|nr:hypothetical protein [Salegentibacter sp. BDJ18]MBO2546122.1 hypothetical protein [Salegentibacter sp. BDJ18]